MDNSRLVIEIYMFLTVLRFLKKIVFYHVTNDIIDWPDWRCKWNANIHINLYAFIYMFFSIFLRENITIINIANVQLYVWIK